MRPGFVGHDAFRGQKRRQKGQEGDLTDEMGPRTVAQSEPKAEGDRQRRDGSRHQRVCDEQAQLVRESGSARDHGRAGGVGGRKTVIPDSRL